ncbi:hypothetical protein HCN44_004085 [Aphidius gifuensis]|uniref:Uncharacterized protein n=1 Tax=Aphidius gifuensis TaxID=684658 RepID=A0A834XYH9_APHGI|nr:hypothetical protein HCN44_004085 [Aphidius gifuensis]
MYYPKILLNTSEILPINNQSFNNILMQMIANTNECENYLTIEIPKQINNTMLYITEDTRYSLFRESINLTNNWYKNLLNNLIENDNTEYFIDMDNNVVDPSAMVSVWLDYIEEFESQFMMKNTTTSNVIFSNNYPVAVYNIFNCLSLTVLNGYAQLVDAYRINPNKYTDDTTDMFKERSELFKETLLEVGKQWEDNFKNLLKIDLKLNLLEFDLKNSGYENFINVNFISGLFLI